MAMVRMQTSVPRQKVVHEMDFFDVDMRVYDKDSVEELNNRI